LTVRRLQEMAIKFSNSKYKVVRSNLSLAVTLISSVVLGFYFYNAAYKFHIDANENEIGIVQDQAVVKEGFNERKENFEAIMLMEQKLETPFQEQIVVNEVLPSRILSQAVSRGGTNPARNSEVDETFLWPTPGHYNITSYYGMRMHPIFNEYKMHTGIDTTAPAGSNIVAVRDGVVILAGFEWSYGNRIVIDHGDGISTMYAHNKNSLVEVGQNVSRGDVIAHVGSTGLSTGPHAHFEVLINGIPVDPMPYLP
jgi:murein DD-endopeptidase MepM/ murein hydrolase activator NlpD